MSEIAKCERCREYNAAAVDFRHQATSAQNDYAALLARHNALVEAVAWERECWDVEMWVQHRLSSPMLIAAYWESDSTYKKARAEVDRLIANETSADCEGGGDE